MKGERKLINGRELYVHKDADHTFAIFFDEDYGSYCVTLKASDLELVEPELGTGVQQEALDATAEALKRHVQNILLENELQHQKDPTVKLLKIDADIITKGLSLYRTNKPQEGLVFQIATLTDIDKKALAGKNIAVKAVISSNTLSYNIPVKLTARCWKESGYDEKHHCIGTKTVDLTPMDQLRYVEAQNREKLNRSLFDSSGFTDECYLHIEETETGTIHKIRLRPNVIALDLLEGKVIDEGGREYKHYDCYVHNKTIVLEAGSVCEFYGKVIAEPRNQRVTLFIEETKAVHGELPDINSLETLRNLMDSLGTVQEKINWILSNYTQHTRIVNRSNIALAYFLGYFSPRHIIFDDKIQRGWTIIGIVGDTTTGKSETAKHMIRLLKAGQLVTGETASVVGLTATAAQTERNEWFVDWGAITLNDLRLLVVDGCQKLKKQDVASLGEAQRRGILTITKAAKNEAYARTRQILIFNPLSEDKKTTRTMSEFFYPCQAIETILDTTSIARLDLTIFISANVKAEDINKLQKWEYDQRLWNLSELLKVVWASKYSIHFTEEAIAEILEGATRLINKFYAGQIPLCSIDMKYKIARLSTALAALTFSYNQELSLLTVSEEHVKYIINFITEEYTAAELHTQAINAMQDKISDSSLAQILSNIKDNKSLADFEDSKLEEILLWIGEKTAFIRDDLKSTFELPENTQLRPLLSMLRLQEIIDYSGKGFKPTSWGIRIAKFIKANNANKDKNDTHPAENNAVNAIVADNDALTNRLATIARELSMLHDSTEFTTDEIISEVRKVQPEFADEYIVAHLERLHMEGRIFKPKPDVWRWQG